MIRALRQSVGWWLRVWPVLLIVAGTLGFSIGVTAAGALLAVVSVSNPLRLPEPRRLAVVDGARLSLGGNLPSASDLLDYAPDWRFFSSLAAWGKFETAINVRVGAEAAERVPAAEVTSAFFQTLGVTPMFGRAFLPGEDLPGRNRVAVVSPALWQRLASVPAHPPTEKTLLLNGVKYSIVGVAPRGFAFPNRAEVWVPIGLGPDRMVDGTSVGYTVFGRLNPGNTLRQAQEQLRASAAALAKSHPDSWIGRKPLALTPLSAAVTQPVRRPLLLIVVAAILFCLAGCANTANILLVRLTRRRDEFSIRYAVGATRSRLTLQAAADAVVLSVVTGLAAVAATLIAIQLVSRYAPAEYLALTKASSPGSVVMWAALLSFVACFVSILPGLTVELPQSFRWRSNSVGRAGPTRQSNRIVFWLVAAQVAAALVLVIAAVFLGDGVSAFRRVDTGFSARTPLVVDLSFPRAVFPTPGRRSALMGEIIERLEALPGVSSAAAISALPLKEPRAIQTSFNFPGREVQTDSEERLAADLTITSGYFKTMGISVIAGRAFDGRDQSSSLPVAIISQRLATRFFHDNAVGQRLRIEPEETPRVIVGVVADVMQFEPGGQEGLQIYQPHTQSSGVLRSVIISYRGEPTRVAATVRRVLRSVNSDLALYNMTSVAAVVEQSVDREVFLVEVFFFFTILAGGLASFGVYAAFEQHVAQRRYEFGVRAAIGATPGNLRGLIVSRCLVVLAAGCMMGWCAAFFVLRFLRVTLYELGASEWSAYVKSTALIVAVGLAVCLLPARRAAATSPAEVLWRE